MGGRAAEVHRPVDTQHTEDPGIARAAEVAALGLATDATPATEERLDAGLRDADPRVRGAAIAAWARIGDTGRARDAWQAAITDPAPGVRRRAAEVAPTLAARAGAGPLVAPLVASLDDGEVTVVDAAAWALGELGAVAVAGGAVAPLAHVVTEHRDALAREAAVAALGALGDPEGLPAVLAGCADKPAVRRRAVLALAPFEGAEVERALQTALEDRDWQVRQAAEDLLR
jgi:HEAT repeat protein